MSGEHMNGYTCEDVEDALLDAQREHDRASRDYQRQIATLTADLESARAWGVKREAAYQRLRSQRDTFRSERDAARARAQRAEAERDVLRGAFEHLQTVHGCTAFKAAAIGLRSADSSDGY